MGSGVYCVDLIHEEAKYRLYLDIYETAAVFSTRVYLATGVIPARQCIVGFQVMLTARQQAGNRHFSLHEVYFFT